MKRSGLDKRVVQSVWSKTEVKSTDKSVFKYSKGVCFGQQLEK